MFRKLFLLSVSMMCFAGVIGTAHAQIPVTDVALITQSASNQAINVAKFIEQVATLKLQYDQLQQTFNALNGLRNIGNLMKNELLSQYLPPDYQQAWQALRNGQQGSLSGISGTLNQIAAANQAQSCSASYTDPLAVANCNQAWQVMSMNKYVGQAGYQQTATNINQLDQFVSSITSTSDPKALQDLQARIQVEQVKMQNEQMKLQTVAMMQKADEDMVRARNAQTTQQAFTAPMNTRWGANANNP